MVNEQSDWDFGEPDEPSFSGAGNDVRCDAWDEGEDELELGLPEIDIRDAFEFDDMLGEPEPEYGDFWPEIDDEEEA